MMTITSMTNTAQFAYSMSRTSSVNQNHYSDAYLYQNRNQPTVSPELEQRLKAYGVSVHFSTEAEAYRSHPQQVTTEKNPPIPLWSAIFKKMGLI